MSKAHGTICNACHAREVLSYSASKSERHAPAPEGMVRHEGRLHKLNCPQLPRAMRRVK